MLATTKSAVKGLPDSSIWTRSLEANYAQLQCGREGLSAAQAASRLEHYGANADRSAVRPTLVHVVVRRLVEPLSLILLAAGVVSIGTGDAIGGTIIVAILILSIGLDTLQQGHAEQAASLLRQSVALKAEALRDGVFALVPVESIVPGDLIRVRAGDIVPADAVVVDASACTINEGALTGEAYPAEKRANTVASATTDSSSALYRGAVVQTGEAVGLVVATGAATLFGAASTALSQAEELSPFQRDLRAYGLLTARLTLALVLVVLAINVALARPLLQSLLFAVALAVGLTPELLPMITTVTLSRGAVRMARRKVIVKRLASIHDLGAMTVLCTDKTGTLTSADITLANSLGADGEQGRRAAVLGAVAASLGGDRGALDAALIAGVTEDLRMWSLSGRFAFDFNLRLGSVLAQGPEGQLLIVKGAPSAVIERCTHARSANTVVTLGDVERAAAMQRVQALAQKGLRAVALASRTWVGNNHELTEADQSALVFEGLCVFEDPPKTTAAAAIARLAAAGVRLKVLSGDDPVVVKRLTGLVGIDAPLVLTGADVANLSDEALAVQVRSVDAYGRLTPEQKSRLVRVLRSSGEVVGYLGDGINDAPASKRRTSGYR